MSVKEAPHYTMRAESASSSPYESGELEMRAFESRLEIRWAGEREWKQLLWHEIAFVADAHTKKLTEELQWLREEAHRQGYEDGLQAGRAAAIREGEKINIEAARMRLKMAGFGGRDSDAGMRP